jgi:hypothetical protein
VAAGWWRRERHTDEQVVGADGLGAVYCGGIGTRAGRLILALLTWGSEWTAAGGADFTTDGKSPLFSSDLFFHSNFFYALVCAALNLT